MEDYTNKAPPPKQFQRKYKEEVLSTQIPGLMGWV